MNATYLLTEVKRSFRNVRYLIFTLGIPLILFLVIGTSWDGKVGGVSATTWYMVNMAVFGATSAVIGTGARIAVERDRGWNRLLRLTPLSGTAYVVGRVVTAMLVALPAVLVVSVAAALTGKVHLSGAHWVEVVSLAWVAILPMAAVGVGLGYLANGDSVQALTGGLSVVFGMFGGLWFPVDEGPTWIKDIAHLTPTYWITELTRAPLTDVWPTVAGWLVLAGWVVVAARVAARRYGQDQVRAA